MIERIVVWTPSRRHEAILRGLVLEAVRQGKIKKGLADHLKTGFVDLGAGANFAVLTRAIRDLGHAAGILTWSDEDLSFFLEQVVSRAADRDVDLDDREEAGRLVERMVLQEMEKRGVGG